MYSYVLFYHSGNDISTGLLQNILRQVETVVWIHTCADSFECITQGKHHYFAGF